MAWSMTAAEGTRMMMSEKPLGANSLASLWSSSSEILFGLTSLNSILRSAARDVGGHFAEAGVNQMALEPGRAAFQEVVAARRGVTCVQIASWRALIPAALVVEGADINAPFIVAAVADEIDDGFVGGEQLGLFAELFVFQIDIDDVVEQFVLRQGGRLDDRLAEFLLKGRDGGVREVEGDDFALASIELAEFVSLCVAGLCDKKQGTSVNRRRAMRNVIGGADAGPRLHQSGGSGGQVFGAFEKVAAAVFAAPHAVVDDGILRQAAVHAITICAATTVDVDVRLDKIAFADFEFSGNARAFLEDGENGFMADDQRVVLEVFLPQFQVVAAETDDFDVGEAEADGFDFRENFVVLQRTDVDIVRSVLIAEIFKTCAVEAPCECFRRNAFHDDAFLWRILMMKNVNYLQ